MNRVVYDSVDAAPSHFSNGNYNADNGTGDMPMSN